MNMRVVNLKNIISYLILASAIFFISATMVVSQPPIQPPGLDIAMEVQDAHTPALMGDPGVVGTAVGLNAAGEPVIQVFAASQRVRGIPRNIEGIPVVVKVTGEIFALPKPPGTPGKGGGGDPPPSAECSDTTDRCERPVPFGVSTGHPSVTAGTIGCRVVDSAGYVYALSNNHVYADENAASVGDDVIQPGSFDGGSLPDDYIGTLDDFVPIVFSPSANNVVDAAIARTDLLDNSTPSDGYGLPKSTTVSPSINLKVKKYGRTTRQTTGRITAINATVTVNYGTGNARFVNQFIVEPGSFSAGGDSGSLIVVDGKGKTKKDDRKPVGLLFAGNALMTVANPIEPVLDAFGVDIDGE